MYQYSIKALYIIEQRKNTVPNCDAFDTYCSRMIMLRDYFEYIHIYIYIYIYIYTQCAFTVQYLLLIIPT